MDKIQKSELGTIQKVTVEKMNFLYLEVPNDPESQQKAWSEFEARFPSLTGRKMYGLDYDEKKVYRVCSLVLESDNGETFGLEPFDFEGGTYIRLRLKFDPPELYEKIGPAYGFLISQYEEKINWALPMIEQYKSKSILDIMVPINN
ncbi:hypothetical protein [Fundicoccus ignavus]|uniref:Bacterial transcription activator effector binding domain-containing protein n=1 Tax=Fundicoccus ignavus TaxID=2664442 RepID=A0A844C4Y5_9LACT|nr:hypothetical protein [Fundicoccus ignavus]MRJ46106.1 hypothetical protein [Fundicoccus ignavus]